MVKYNCARMHDAQQIKTSAVVLMSSCVKRLMLFQYFFSEWEKNCQGCSLGVCRWPESSGR